jgi:hypothetical protein
VFEVWILGTPQPLACKMSPINNRFLFLPGFHLRVFLYAQVPFETGLLYAVIPLQTGFNVFVELGKKFPAFNAYSRN